MADNQTSDLAKAIQDISETASRLVREEIELAKAEMTEKLTKLAKGAVVGIIAGVFAVFGLVYLLHSAAWLIWQLTGTRSSFWIGFAVVAVVLFVLGGLAAFIAMRALKRGSPPVPAMAIQEGRLIKETVIHPQAAVGAGTSAAVTEARR
jgi:uncharacterized membrane protein YqjE